MVRNPPRAPRKSANRLTVEGVSPNQPHANKEPRVGIKTLKLAARAELSLPMAKVYNSTATKTDKSKSD